MSDGYYKNEAAEALHCFKEGRSDCSAVVGAILAAVREDQEDRVISLGVAKEDPEQEAQRVSYAMWEWASGAPKLHNMGKERAGGFLERTVRENLDDVRHFIFSHMDHTGRRHYVEKTV